MIQPPISNLSHRKPERETNAHGYEPPQTPDISSNELTHKRLSAAELKPTQIRRRAPAPNSESKYVKEDVSEALIQNVFQYNTDLGIIFLPVIITLLSFGGVTVMEILVVGLILSYLADSLDAPTVSLVVFGTTLSVAGLAFWAIGLSKMGLSLFSLTILSNIALFIAIGGCWGILQLTWLQDTYGSSIVLAERALFGFAFLPSTILLMWAVISIFGFSRSQYFICIVLYVVFRSVCLPRISSFKYPDEDSLDDIRRAYIQDRAVTIIQSVFLLFVPSIFYVSLHPISETFSLTGIADLGLLFCISLLTLRSFLDNDALWWMSLNRQQLEFLKRPLTALVLYVAAICFEIRVIFNILSQYISIPLPFAVITVTIAMLSFSTLLITLTVTKPDRDYDRRHHERNYFVGKVAFALGICSTAASLGLPFYLWPVVAAGLVFMDVFERKRQFHYYLAFVFAATTVMAWVVRRTFWHLTFRFQSPDISIQQMLLACVVLAVVCMLIPGFVILNISPLTSSALLVQALAGIAFTEYVLTQEFYPSYLVVFTSALGCYVIYQLDKRSRISSGFQWILYSCGVFKLLLLLPQYPQSAPRYVVLIHGLLVTCSVTLLLLYRPSSSRRSGSALGSESAGTSVKPKMSLFVGIGCCGSIIGLIFLSKDTLMAEIVASLLGYWPSTTAILATAFICASLAILPLSLKHFVHWKSLRRFNFFLLTLAVLYAIIQPSLMLEHDDSFGMHSTIPRWALFLSLALPAASALDILPLKILSVAIISSVCLAFYLCGTFFPLNWAVYTLLALMFSIAASFVVYLYFPDTEQAGDTTRIHESRLSWLYAAFVALLPFTYLIESQLSLFPRATRLSESMRLSLFAVSAMLNLLVALSIKFRIGMKIHRPTKEMFQTSSFGYERVKKTKTYDVAGLGEQTILNIGNVSAVLSLVLCVYISLFLGPRGIYVLLLSTTLLLLNQNPGVFEDLSESRRYYPVVLFISAYCLAATFWNVVILGFLSDYFMLEPLRMQYWKLVANAVLMVCTIPSQQSVFDFAWGNRHQDSFTLFCYAPLNILPLIFGDFGSLQILALVGLCGILLQFYLQFATKRRGRLIL